MFSKLFAQLIQFLAQRGITDENSVLEVVRFNYGSKDKNPIENVKCYNKYTPNRAFKIEQSQVSSHSFTVMKILTYLILILIKIDIRYASNPV